MPSSPAYCSPLAYHSFVHELHEIHRPLGLFRAASAIALHSRPEASIDDACEAINKLAGAVRSRVRSRTDQALLAHLHDVMFEVAGFRGNSTDYYNPANSYLPDVLRTRRGIPISLTLVYRTIASLVGLRVEGINAPGHFLASVTIYEGATDHTLFVDPFHGGVLLNEHETIELISGATGRQERATPATLAIASPSDWLLRSLRNLQGVFAHRGQVRDQLAMQELQAAIE
ncbi:hypothetical protein KOR34_10660 [Posidoniimonas corsicana]|uniref:Protein SirB1 N-terminal domain-containing protein n=1 Tax=Posidoniimonas corsicana TaxID=1938618 RepID=A0A5C5VEN8_9BACT|nr:transglutaminase-like domain-containing protein [Posidoniimonas corsicana]TWT36165.1 hypothetical protein KOR34_10660 [Posidoniimonas corsicana]